MSTFWQDFRYGMRMLLKNPAFTSVAVLTLALGIGANTAIFSVVNSVLLGALPYKDADRLAMIYESSPREARNVANPANFMDWKEQNSSFSDMAGFVDSRSVLVGDGEPEELPMQFATPNLFSVLGVEAFMGRTLLESDGQPNQPRAVVLSYGLWQRRFGSDANIIGRKLNLDRQDAIVVGVMPPNFQWFIRKGSLTAKAAEIWLPFRITSDFRVRRGRFMQVVGRLKPGVTMPQAHAEMKTIGSRLEQQFNDFNANWGVNVVALREQLTGDIRLPLLIMLGAVGFVLLIACANVANLLLARAATRQKEIAIRAALGARRWRVIRQLFTEGLPLAVLGGIFGLLLAWWGTSLLATLSPPELIDLSQVKINLKVLAFTLGVSLLTGMIFSLAPSLESTRLNLSDSLKEGVKGGSTTGTNRLRSVLVVVQVALALVLLVCAGLLIRSFNRLNSVDPGFNPENVLTIRVVLPGRKYDQEAKVVGFFKQALERIQALPGVESTGAISFLPFAGPYSGTNFEIGGLPLPAPGQGPITGVCVTDVNYFKAMQIPLKRGRLFTEQEATEARHVVVINEALARRYFPNEEAIGKRIKIYMKDEIEPSEIIGIVADSRHKDLDGEIEPMSYWPHPELAFPFMTLVIRTKGDAANIAASARNVIQTLDPEQPVSDVRTLESVLAKSIAKARFSTLLLTVFAGVALVLAAVGIYGVISYLVTQRLHEIGVRMALGAQARDVLKLVLRNGMVLALVGVVIGLGGAFALTRVMRTLLFGVTPTDAVTFATVSVLLMLVALFACYIPARRATKVDPLMALRYE
ncbi:MAG TPA: ABC transporter permease [Pyrinomonadaceae bacterium]|nr:ABC transporter permease [Pyrinomonadaceae bacterium]